MGAGVNRSGHFPHRNRRRAFRLNHIGVMGRNIPVLQAVDKQDRNLAADDCVFPATRLHVQTVMKSPNKNPPFDRLAERKFFPTTARCGIGVQNAHTPLREMWQRVIPRPPRKSEFHLAATATTVRRPWTRPIRTCSADVRQSQSNLPSGECRRPLASHTSPVRRHCCRARAHRASSTI